MVLNNIESCEIYPIFFYNFLNSIFQYSHYQLLIDPLGKSNPIIKSIIVDFPLPDSPTIPTKLPFLISRLHFFKTKFFS